MVVGTAPHFAPFFGLFVGLCPQKSSQIRRIAPPVHQGVENNIDALSGALCRHLIRPTVTTTSQRAQLSRVRSQAACQARASVRS